MEKIHHYRLHLGVCGKKFLENVMEEKKMAWDSKKTLRLLRRRQQREEWRGSSQRGPLCANGEGRSLNLQGALKGGNAQNGSEGKI